MARSSAQPTSNKIHDVALALGVKVDGWYAEAAEGLLAPFTGDADKLVASLAEPEKRKGRRIVHCSVCLGKCRWSDDAWVCTSCGAEWYADHDPVKYRSPDEDTPEQGNRA